MSLRSHVDPCSFIVFMHVQDLKDELVDVLKAIRFRHGESFDPVLERLQPRSHQVLFHEIYHYWQGLRLPFLYRYAFIAFLKVWQAFKELGRTGLDYREWSCLLPELLRLDLKARLGYAPGGKIFWGGPQITFPADTAYDFQASPLDLLECAASLAEFQFTVTAQERVDAAVLHRWRKRNAAYLDPFFFASNYLGDEVLALRALLPLINASFATTEPTRAFVELLARVRGNFTQVNDARRRFLEQPEPCRWRELFTKWVAKLDFEAPPDSCTKILGTVYYHLTLDAWVMGGLRYDNHVATHPFLGPAARRWHSREYDQPEYGWVLDYPGWMSPETFRTCRTEFSPPVTVFRFHMPDGADRTFLWGTGDISGFTSFPSEEEDPGHRGFITDFMTMYGVVRRASGAHFDGYQRTCHHRECPHFESNFCNAYPIVPEQFEECGFPARIDRLVQLERGKNACPEA